MSPVRLAAVLVLAWTATGCAFVGSLRSEPETRPTESYREIVKRWSRTTREYDELATKLYAGATYKSWPFRQAYVAEYARIFLLPEREREAMLAREIEAYERFHEFVLAGYAPVREFADFSSKRGLWRLYLQGPGGRVPPVSVEPIREPLLVLEAFYPYVDRWSRVFLVRFPRRTPEGREVLPDPLREPFRLILASTEARADLDWAP